MLLHNFGKKHVFGNVEGWLLCGLIIEIVQFLQLAPGHVGLDLMFVDNPR